MAGPVTDTHRITYRENVQLALQEKKDQFGDAFMYDGDLKGKQVQITDIVGPSDARLDAPEGGDTPDIDVTHEPIWVRPRRIDWGKVIKKEDQIKALTDYKSTYVQGGAGGIMRKKNIILSDALFGPRLIGNEVPVATPWNGSSVNVQIGVVPAADTGMNVKKILNAFKYMELKEIDIEEEELYMALDPTEIEQLYYDLTYVSKDYRSKAVLEDKRVLSILGVQIIPTQRLADSTPGSVSTAALWCKSGMVWGEFSPLDIKSEPNPAKQYREHPYMEMWVGASRVMDEKVVKILNKY